MGGGSGPGRQGRRGVRNHCTARGGRGSGSSTARDTCLVNAEGLFQRDACPLRCQLRRRQLQGTGRKAKRSVGGAAAKGGAAGSGGRRVAAAAQTLLRAPSRWLRRPSGGGVRRGVRGGERSAAAGRSGSAAPTACSGAGRRALLCAQQLVELPGVCCRTLEQVPSSLARGGTSPHGRKGQLLQRSSQSVQQCRVGPCGALGGGRWAAVLLPPPPPPPPPGFRFRAIGG